MFLWRHTRGASDGESHCIATSERIEGGRPDTGHHRAAKGEVLHQRGKLETRPVSVFTDA